ncbi:hypothetical protein [Priestia megaterium]|uniref:hypothetical protein n=1 Tax=Priestia megaterium TaxID=1404 RepID=UPI0034D728DF
MKAIIDNKLYDTDKAELVFEFVRTYKVRSVLGTYFNETGSGQLYKTSTGNWFEVIEAEGKAPELNALAVEDAKRITSIDPDKYQELFGALEEA